MAPDVRKARDVLTSWAGVISLGLAVVVGASYLYETDKQADQTSCQAKYNSAFTRSLDARSNAGAARQDAVDNLLIGVTNLILDQPETEEEKAAAGVIYLDLFRTYIETKEANDEARARNPYPEIPDCN